MIYLIHVNVGIKLLFPLFCGVFLLFLITYFILLHAQRLRKRRREKKELEESPQADAAADDTITGGTEGEQAAEQADPLVPPRRLMVCILRKFTSS